MASLSSSVENRPDLVPKLLLSFKCGVQLAKQRKKISQHRFTAGLTFVLHPLRNTKPLPSSLCDMLYSGEELAWFIHPFSKLRRGWSAEVICCWQAPLEVTRAVDYVLELVVSSAPLSVIFRLNPTEIWGRLGVFRFSVQACRWTGARSILQ